MLNGVCTPCNKDQYYDENTHSCNYCPDNEELVNDLCVPCDVDQLYDPNEHKCYYCEPGNVKYIFIIILNQLKK